MTLPESFSSGHVFVIHYWKILSIGIIYIYYDIVQVPTSTGEGLSWRAGNMKQRLKLATASYNRAKTNLIINITRYCA